MEVMVEVYTDDPPTGTRKSTSTARITYVAIDAKGRPTAVPALRVVSEEERRRYDDAKRRREAEGRA
jgi:acyl-CoA hydrolase